ncbi:hypothetical protein Anapl_12338 [Anas platyrhynchos]|uniref:Uncharacterized protein n=1 Tax=Anas platyrhynchos TaxID=8839 RepID=R0LG08_ANAPL|nr:hypothetical protein Anapl_12338 [Anas platyrhynchos]
MAILSQTAAPCEEHCKYNMHVRPSATYVMTVPGKQNVCGSHLLSLFCTSVFILFFVFACQMLQVVIRTAVCFGVQNWHLCFLLQPRTRSPLKKELTFEVRAALTGKGLLFGSCFGQTCCCSSNVHIACAVPQKTSQIEVCTIGPGEMESSSWPEGYTRNMLCACTDMKKLGGDEGASANQGCLFGVKCTSRALPNEKASTLHFQSLSDLSPSSQVMEISFSTANFFQVECLQTIKVNFSQSSVDRIKTRTLNDLEFTVRKFHLAAAAGGREPGAYGASSPSAERSSSGLQTRRCRPYSRAGTAAWPLDYPDRPAAKTNILRREESTKRCSARDGTMWE